MRRASLPAAFLAIAISEPSIGWAVDGVVEINQTRMSAGGITPGDAPGAPAQITVSGSYRLTGNLSTSNFAVNAIEITANDVALDLNGFTIRGPAAGTSGTGTGIQGTDADNVTVRNGTVRFFRGAGVRLGDRARVEALRVEGNASAGILVGEDGVVIQSTVVENGGDGIRVGYGGSVRECQVNRNGRYGVSAGSSSFVQGNTIVENANFGLKFDFVDGVYVDNVITRNAGDSANAQIDRGTSLGHNYCGTDTTCP